MKSILKESCKELAEKSWVYGAIRGKYKDISEDGDIDQKDIL